MITANLGTAMADASALEAIALLRHLRQSPVGPTEVIIRKRNPVAVPISVVELMSSDSVEGHMSIGCDVSVVWSLLKLSMCILVPVSWIFDFRSSFAILLNPWFSWRICASTICFSAFLGYQYSPSGNSQGVVAD